MTLSSAYPVALAANKRIFALWGSEKIQLLMFWSLCRIPIPNSLKGVLLGAQGESGKCAELPAEVVMSWNQSTIIVQQAGSTPTKSIARQNPASVTCFASTKHMKSMILRRGEQAQVWIWVVEES